jgi:hypothetical protein
MHAPVHRGHRRFVGETQWDVLAGDSPMDIESYGAHYEAQTTIDAPSDLGFEYLDDIEQLGAHMTLSIRMMLPTKGYRRLLGRLAGGVHARWCVRNVLDQAAGHFGNATEVAVRVQASKGA